MYNTIPEYKKQINKVLKQYKKQLVKLDEWLKKDYHKTVVADEMQAYIISDFEFLKDEDIILPKTINTKLKQIHKKFKGKHK
jgi:hypothetical protein